MENLFATKVYCKIKPVLNQISETSQQLSYWESLKKPKELTLTIQNNAYEFLQIIEEAIANYHLNKPCCFKRKTENSKESFIEFLSHEIRNSINSIIGFSQIIDSTKSSLEQKAVYTYIILNSIGKLNRVVESIQEYAELVCNLKPTND